MYYKKIIKLVVPIFLFVFMSLLFMAPQIEASSRDCDSNAVIYCGTLTKTELRNKLSKGTGKTYQSSTELQKLFKYYGFEMSHIDGLSEGTVTKDDKVIVNNKTVATNVKSMGRSYITGSTKVTAFSYPIYLRSPSISFVSSTIPAFVRLNPNGTMRYAIIKSCGNIVPGVSYTEPTYSLTVSKFEDVNKNKLRDSGEPLLAGWVFDVTGPNGYTAQLTTGTNGSITKTGLKAGTYTIKERQKTGWSSTTGLSKNVTITNSNQSVSFGNAKVVLTQVSTNLIITKFWDSNGDGVFTEGEEKLSGWQFRITGPNDFDETLTTDDQGLITKNNVTPGLYEITEIPKEGWESTTGLTIKREITSDPVTQEFYFGNREILIDEPVITKTEETKRILPSTGPLEVAAAVLASILVSGSLIAWLKSKKRFNFSFRK
jgi:hypothetical protein